MTRREFLKLSLLLAVASFLNPVGVFGRKTHIGGNYDFSYRRKGRIYKFQPPFAEVVRHRGENPGGLPFGVP